MYTPKHSAESAEEVSSEYIQKNSWKFFNRISRRYDFLNHTLSGGQDILWRKAVTNYILGLSVSNPVIVDIATGTADQLIDIVRRFPETWGVGVDMSEGMLAVGYRKVHHRHLSQSIHFIQGNALKIPLQNGFADIAMISFGIRNITDITAGLEEMFRVLKSGGSAIILEFSLPENNAFRLFYLFYLRNILPIIGGALSGDYRAYRYLNETIEAFPYGKKFCSIMKRVGFQKVKAIPLTFGIASIYTGKKC